MTKPVPPNRANPAAVQRLRLQYARRGRLRFSSHRDFQRALERAVRRAGVPVAYSSGFSPHPKISYAGAAPTGAASEAEYVEIGVTQPVDPDTVRQRLDTALPVGLDVVRAVVAGDEALADRLQASDWEICLPGVGVETLSASVDALLGWEIVEVERMTKSGRKSFDIRRAIARCRVTDGSRCGANGGSCAILHVVVRHAKPAVRPDDVLAGLAVVSGLELDDAPRATRRAQGPCDEESGAVGDPLAPDRDAPAR